MISKILYDVLLQVINTDCNFAQLNSRNYNNCFHVLIKAWLLFNDDTQNWRRQLFDRFKAIILFVIVTILYLVVRSCTVRLFLIFYFFFLFSVSINCSGHYKTVERPRQTPNVWRHKSGVENRTLVLETLAHWATTYLFFIISNGKHAAVRWDNQCQC